MQTRWIQGQRTTKLRPRHYLHAIRRLLEAQEPVSEQPCRAVLTAEELCTSFGWKNSLDGLERCPHASRSDISVVTQTPAHSSKKERNGPGDFERAPTHRGGGK